DGHALRVRALSDWLNAACGDYAPLRRRFVSLYLAFVAAHLERYRDAIADKLRPFDGLYRVEDFFWSALRPLPRAWLPVGGASVRADFAFWDGSGPIAVMLGDSDTANDAALASATIAVCRLPATTLSGDPETTIATHLPASVQKFWSGETLPMSPF